MSNIMYACIIMHNMIIKNENSEKNLEPLFEVEALTGIRRALSFEALVVGIEQLENIEQHYSLRGDLVEQTLHVSMFSYITKKRTFWYHNEWGFLLVNVLVCQNMSFAL
jgi:hypothetical protein